MSLAAARATPLEIVKRSPALVKAHDKAAWLALFTEAGVIEDPVGAGAYVGRARHSKFWDAFIAPNEVTFRPHREFEAGEIVIRYVTISTVTPVSAAPFELKALLEYVVRGEQIASLRAFWPPRLAVGWHARQGVRGLVGLSKHGLRMTGGLGIKSAMGFSRALVPPLSEADGRSLAERLARAIGGRRADWLALTGRARVTVGAQGDDAERAWDAAIGPAPRMQIEDAIVAGDHLACVLSSGDRAAAIIAQVRGAELAAVRVVFSG